MVHVRAEYEDKEAEKACEKCLEEEVETAWEQ
jgi:hypothetical protein